MVINLLTDVLYKLVDPRVVLQMSAGARRVPAATRGRHRAPTRRRSASAAAAPASGARPGGASAATASAWCRWLIVVAVPAC